MCKLSVIVSRTAEDRGILSANRKSCNYVPRRLAQQRMTLSDVEWPFHASHAISAVAELFVCGCWLSGQQ